MKYNFPLIHMNGNNGQTLLEEYQEAMQAVSTLREKMSKIEFHPRDYYPLGMEAYDNAKQQRIDMIDKINDLDGYLTAHAINIYEQINK
jgi:hypothetical protein